MINLGFKLPRVRKFEFGQIVFTRGIVYLIAEKHKKDAENDKDYIANDDELNTALDRYALCDWGELPKEDKQENDRAIKAGNRLLGVYRINGQKIYIITEWDRSATTVLLPEEY